MIGENASNARIFSAVVLAGLAGFLALTALAAAAYPGGTFCDAHAPAYEFWGNFFCDLTQPVTQRGEANERSRALAEAAFAAFAVALGPFFWLLGGEAYGHARAAVRGFGAVAAFGTLVVALLPSRVSPLLHQTAVFAAAAPGLVATFTGVWGALRRGRARAADVSSRVTAWLGVGALLSGFVAAAGYAYAVANSGPCYAWLPGLQKIAALLLVCWMGAVARAAGPPRPRSLRR